MTRRVLVTGARGFVGSNLMARLATQEGEGFEAIGCDIDTPESEMLDAAATADCIIHLAGANRPSDPSEFTHTNVDLTSRLLQRLADKGRKPDIVATSSIQAALDNPYGVSKRGMEERLAAFAAASGARVATYRLANLFGKWCRPNYNSVVATFCHNVTHGLPLRVDDPAKTIEFVYVDDVVDSLVAFIKGKDPEMLDGFATAGPRFTISLGRLADTLTAWADGRHAGLVPDLGDPFNRRLWATFLSYLEPGDFDYSADLKTDARGSLFEAVKTERGGQIFVSRTKPGITRGNHYHDTKTEKFIVLSGIARISFRHIRTGTRHDIDVSGDAPRIVDIPPGWTHLIRNTGDTELLTLFWASEKFDPAWPDTFAAEVQV